MTPDQESQSLYVTPKEVVSLLAERRIEVTDDTVRNWITKGIQNKKAPERRHYLRGLRIGGRLFVERGAIDVFVLVLQDSGE